MSNASHWTISLLGLDIDATDLTFLQISLRGIVVFFATLTMIRMGDKRFLSKRSAFDAVVGFILASMLARAINGNSAFVPTIAGGFVIVGLHRLLAFLTRDAHRFGILVKGDAQMVVQDGNIKRAVMKANDLSDHDLLEDLRINGNVNDLKQVKAAYYERNGQISVVRQD